MTTQTDATIAHEIGSAGSIDIRGHEAEIELRGVDGTTIRVHGTGERPLHDAFKIETGPGLFKMSAAKSAGFGLDLLGRRCPPIQVEVPRDARVLVETVSGEIQVEGLRGVQRYRTMSGDVRLESSAGRIAIDTVSGDVRVRSNSDLEAEVRTLSGDTEITASTIRSLQTRTTSGDVRLAGRFDEAGPFSVETVSGDVTISPIGAVRVEGTTVSGDVRSSIPHSSGGRAGRRTIELGKGGPLIAFRSISGDVQVRSDEPSRPAEPARPPEPPRPTAPTRLNTDDEVRLAILRELESGAIDTTEAERRLNAFDDSVGSANSPGAKSTAPQRVDWVRRV